MELAYADLKAQAEKDGWKIEWTFIKKVRRESDGYSITKDDGWSFWITDKDLEGKSIVPQIGMPVGLVGKGLGFQIHGIVLADVVLRYSSKEEVERDWFWQKSAWEWEKIWGFFDNYSKWIAAKNELLDPLRERWERFAKESPDFLHDGAGYELYCLQGADALARWAQSKSAFPETQVKLIEEWWEKPYDEQLKEVPNFGDQHSGHTAGGAVYFAKRVVLGEPV